MSRSKIPGWSQFRNGTLCVHEGCERRLGAGPGPWNSVQPQVPRGLVAAKSTHGVMLRGACAAGVEFVRHWILVIQHSKKRPGGVAVKTGAWVDGARGTCGVGTGFAGLVLWNSGQREVPRGGVSVKIGAWVDATRGACKVGADFARGQSLGIQPSKKCPGGWWRPNSVHGLMMRGARGSRGL